MVLSYRHAFHAGNPADVLKHSVLTAVIAAATAKPKPLVYVDTHAGSGLYDLTATPAASRGEHRAGIETLQHLASCRPVPAAIARYLEAVAAWQKDPRRPVYPGSPALAIELLRPIDRLVLGERHPADQIALTRLVERARNVRVEPGDGYTLLRSELPPREGRGIVLIDPAYELDSEASTLVEGLRTALKRFRHGVYLIWYPLTGKLDHRRLVQRITRLAPPSLLRLEVPGSSGVLVVNPPWSARQDLTAAHEFLVRHFTSDTRL